MKVLLINPAQTFLYENTKIKAGEITAPVLSLATISAVLLANKIDVEIVDLLIHDKEYLNEKLNDKELEYIGITFTTPLYEYAKKLASQIKKTVTGIKLVCGGAHTTSMYKEILESSDFDIAVIGEGDFTFRDIVKCKSNLSQVRGIAYKDENGIKVNDSKDFIQDLDLLPFPAWNLFNIDKYKNTALLSEKNPVGWLETSRGCIYGCVYCNKNIFGRGFRVKSPERVVDEMEYMIKSGFKEIHIADDGFTTDMARAEEICDIIIKRKISIPWATVTGIRVDRVNPGLLKKMKSAGCYRVFFGIETGSEKISKIIKKGATNKQVIDAVRWSREAGLEIFGFFMFGLPGDTEETMRVTTDFALSLDLDMAKASITVPLPGTPFFNGLKNEHRLLTEEWSKYNLYIPAREIYEHSDTSWDIIEKQYNSFYKKFYLRPSFIFKTFLRVLKKRKLLIYIKYFLQTKW